MIGEINFDLLTSNASLSVDPRQVFHFVQLKNNISLKCVVVNNFFSMTQMVKGDFSELSESPSLRVVCCFFSYSFSLPSLLPYIQDLQIVLVSHGGGGGGDKCFQLKGPFFKLTIFSRQ